MIVIDTSIFVDSLFEKNKERYRIANKFLAEIRGLIIYVPKVFLIELLLIARRLGSMKGISKELLNLLNLQIIIS